MQLRRIVSIGVLGVGFVLSAQVHATSVGNTRIAPRAEQSADIDVGTRLVATSDVTLREVTLSKGSRVVVVKVSLQNGRPATVDVELADGHILKRISMATIHKSFVAEND